MTEKEFPKGIRFYEPSERAPKFIRGSISVNVNEFFLWAEQHKNERGYLNLDVKESKGGKVYVDLNTYQPGNRTVKPPVVEEEEDGDMPY